MVVWEEESFSSYQDHINTKVLGLKQLRRAMALILQVRSDCLDVAGKLGSETGDELIAQLSHSHCPVVSKQLSRKQLSSVTASVSVMGDHTSSDVSVGWALCGWQDQSESHINSVLVCRASNMLHGLHMLCRCLSCSRAASGNTWHPLAATRTQPSGLPSIGLANFVWCCVLVVPSMQVPVLFTGSIRENLAQPSGPASGLLILSGVVLFLCTQYRCLSSLPAASERIWHPLVATQTQPSGLPSGGPTWLLWWRTGRLRDSGVWTLCLERAARLCLQGKSSCWHWHGPYSTLQRWVLVDSESEWALSPVFAQWALGFPEPCK